MTKEIGDPKISRLCKFFYTFHHLNIYDVMLICVARFFGLIFVKLYWTDQNTNVGLVPVNKCLQRRAGLR